jgi:uncharacterized protein (TIGR00661 family)
VALPEQAQFERKLTRSVIRVFTAGADRVFGYHYTPASHRCLPPVLRPEVSRLRAEPGGHLLVYNQGHTADGGGASELTRWAWRNQRRVRAYGFPEAERGTHGLVTFCPASRSSFLEDLRTARAVLTMAGFTTAVEAFVLRKPVAVVPLRGQWEQQVNAFHLDQAGLAAQFSQWDYDRLLDLEATAEGHPLRDWLTVSPEQVLDFVLGDDGASGQPIAKSPRARAA